MGLRVLPSTFKDLSEPSGDPVYTPDEFSSALQLLAIFTN
jgi:hypothetical protein